MVSSGHHVGARGKARASLQPTSNVRTLARDALADHTGGMPTLSNDLTRLIVRELDGCVREVQSFADDRQLWATLPGVTNSAGNLALHLCGNLRHFVGAGLCGTGYVRNREAEFAARQGTRAEIVAELTSTIATMHATLGTLDDDVLDRPMPGAPRGLVTSTRLFLLHLVAHTAFHLGQMGYLRRVLAGDAAASADPLPLDVLGADTAR